MSPALDSCGLPLGYPFKPDLEITPREAHALLHEPGSGLLLLDCRTPAEWEAAHVEGSTLLPLGELSERIDELNDHRDQPIAVMCHHGVRSMKATLFLRQAGFVHARSVAGGIDLWSIAADPSIGRYQQVNGRCVTVGGDR